MKCPRCGLINPDSALSCDCGYVFSSAQATPTAPTTVHDGAVATGRRLPIVAVAALMIAALLVVALVPQARESVLPSSALWGTWERVTSIQELNSAEFRSEKERQLLTFSWGGKVQAQLAGRYLEGTYRVLNQPDKSRRADLSANLLQIEWPAKEVPMWPGFYPPDHDFRRPSFTVQVGKDEGGHDKLILSESLRFPEPVASGPPGQTSIAHHFRRVRSAFEAVFDPTPHQ